MYPNPECAQVETTARLCERAYYFDKEETDSPELLEFEKKLNGIHGIKRAEVGRHEIHLKRYEVFEWDELLSQVYPMLAEFVGVGKNDLDIKVIDQQKIDHGNHMESEFDENYYN